TTTTLGRPLRVMVCGSFCARSITSDSRALALATVQRSSWWLWLVDMAAPIQVIMTIVTIWDGGAGQQGRRCCTIGAAEIAVPSTSTDSTTFWDAKQRGHRFEIAVPAFFRFPVSVV